MKIVKGIVIVRPNNDHEILPEPMTLQDALFLQEAFETMEGYKVYIGSEIKHIKAKKIASNLLGTAIGIVE